MTTAPAFAIFDLFVGKNGLVFWTPPLVRFFLVGETFFVELKEAPLGPFIVFWIRCINFAIPIYGITEALSLLAEVGNVGFGDILRGGASFDGVIFGGKPESVVAKWAQNIQPLLSVEPRKYINNGKVTDVTDMEASAGGIGKHFGKHHFGLAGFFGSLKRLGFFPDFLPFLFDFERFVSFHRVNYTIIIGL